MWDLKVVTNTAHQGNLVLYKFIEILRRCTGFIQTSHEGTI